MSVDFAGVKAVTVPEGSVKRITRRSDGAVIWEKVTQGEIVYHGTVTELSTARYNFAATTVGDYALFAGGYLASGVSHIKTIDVYNAVLTRNTPITLSEGRYALGATTVGDYALFAGGWGRTSIDAYNTALTQSTPTALSNTGNSIAATVGEYALMATGSGTYSNYDIEVYDIMLTKKDPITRTYAGVSTFATNNNYVLLATNTNVEAYDSTLTHTVATSLQSRSRSYVDGATVGDYALFAGGSGNMNAQNDTTHLVDAYDTSLTRLTPTSLSVGRYDTATVTIGNYALIAGGRRATVGATNVVDTYDTALTRSTATALSESRYYATATAVGSYALVGGGANSVAVGGLNVVDVYEYIPPET